MSGFSIYRLAVGDTDCSRVPVLLFSRWNWMGAKVCCALGVVQTIILKAGGWFFYTGYSICTTVSQTKSLVHVLKPKAYLIDSGLQMQELNWWAVGRGEENYEAFWIMLFFKNSISVTLCKLEACISEQLFYICWGLFSCFAAYFEILKKKIILPWRIQKAQSLTGGVQGHVGLCPALTLLHEGHDAHQFFLIAFRYKLEHFVFSLTGVVLP